MAHFERRGNRWRAQVRRRGVVQSRTFRTKAQAREWALQVEAGITGESRPLGRHRVLDALQRYSKEVSPTKRGARWEKVRIRAFCAEPLSEFVKRQIGTTTEDHVGVWRNGRLQQVSPSTVRREMNLLDSVFEIARREWKWIRVNPFRDVKKPPEPRPRRRGVKLGELESLSPVTPSEREVVAGFELGIETGMRAGEMWTLGREQIDLAAQIARLDETKNGDARDVALSLRAVEIIRGLLADGRPMLFTIAIGSRDVIFRRMRDAAGIKGLHFHDSRSEATTRLSKKLKVQDLADQLGHRDLNSLMFYYKPSAADRARQLDAPQTTQSPPKRPSGVSPRRRSRGSGSGNPAL